MQVVDVETMHAKEVLISLYDKKHGIWLQEIEAVVSIGLPVGR